MAHFLTEMDLPGQDMDFFDVTGLFAQASSEMGQEDMIFMQGFSLHDAMSAFEIGEPRLDTGLITEEEKNTPPFNPLMPLLPEELCWILDEMLAYEMQWHAGNPLSNTVYTLNYAHHLAKFDPEAIPYPDIRIADASRPLELTTVVLRAAVMGLLKSCDLCWRELSKGGMQETEDWHAEKCDISLLESLPAKFVISKLEDASLWLSSSSSVSLLWKEALQSRIQFRKLLESNASKDAAAFRAVLDVARLHLANIKSRPPPEPAEDSSTRFAFDPWVARKLSSFVPIRKIDLPPRQETWQMLEKMLDGWHEMSLLAEVHELSTWDNLGHVRLWSVDKPLQFPYIRSSTQSTFYDGILVLDSHSLSWLVEQFFFETLGISYASLALTIKGCWASAEAVPLFKVERILYQLITPHIRSHWYNPPRKRRHFMKSLVDWHRLYDNLYQIIDQLDTSELEDDRFILHLPYCALLWRLNLMREVVLSGFQLELYAPEERPFAYWYAADIVDTHLRVLDSCIPLVPPGSIAYQEMKFQHWYLTALGAMCEGMFGVSVRIAFSWDHLRQTLGRRYKWAFRPEYEEIETPPVCQPDIHRFREAYSRLKSDEYVSPRGSFELAQTILRGIVEREFCGGWVGVWGHDRLQFINGLVSLCEDLKSLPEMMSEVPSFDLKRLKWDPHYHPWFPRIS